MKVAYLMGPFTRGGAETLALDVCRNAAEAGLDLLLFHRKDGILAEDFQNSGVELIKLTPRSPFDLWYLMRLRKEIKQRGINILHAHQAIDAVYGILATVGMPTKVVLSLHSHGVDDSFVSSTLRRLAVLRADRVMFVSKNQRDHYVRRFGPIKQGRVGFNGLDFSKFNIRTNDSLRKKLAIPAATLLLGAVGNFSPGRDQMTTCRFLSLLQKEGIPFRFVFIGGALKAYPELYQQCVDYCQEHELTDHVNFLGQRSDVPALLPQLDAFVYSTVHDTFGIAVVEAIAVGIPVFVNDWKVMREVTNDGAWATLYRSKDENDLLQKFVAFHENRESYREESRRNARAVKERYGIKQYLNSLKATYRPLLPF